MKNFMPVFIFLFFSLGANAQQKKIAPQWLNLTGIVADSNSSMRIAGATIEISIRPGDPSQKKQSSFPNKIAITNSAGDFEIDHIPIARSIYLSVSAIGYKTVFKKIIVSPPDRNYLTLAVNAGVIKLAKEYKSLDAVVVSSKTKSLLELQNDKRVFLADKAIVSQGGTAIDLFRTIPSVSVDADGAVTMRSASPQILVDGRPSFLTPDQIPADMIEKVELITNPSARYDASSSGGVINIVLKKNKVAGINGMASVGAGLPGIFNANTNLNLRQKKFNVFVGGNYNQSGGNVKEQSYRENKSNDIITDFFTQQSQSKRNRAFLSLRGGIDYYLSKKTTLSYVQSIGRGRNDAKENQYQEFLDQEKNIQYTGTRLADRKGRFVRNSSRFSIDQKLRDDETLSADITINSSSGKSNSSYSNNFFLPDGNIYSAENQVRANGDSKGQQVTLQVDYARKFSENKRVEAGLRVYHNNSSAVFNSFQLNSSQEEIKLPLSNNYRYTENVNAGYFNYANKWKSFSYQAGLRIELSDFKGLLVDSNARFGYHFPDGLKNLDYAFFPSFFISRPLNENSDIQLSYSKRIRRPGFWQVNPYIDINDPMNIRLGNPQLKPEYTNSIEFNFLNRFKKGGSILTALYFKNNVGDITQFSDTLSTELYQQLNNASVSPDAILNSYINAGYTNRTGVEVIIEKKIFKNLELTYSGEAQYRITRAHTNKFRLNNEGLNFETKLTTAYRFQSTPSNFFNNLNLQFSAAYESPRVIPQGKIKSRFVSDFAIRKEFLKKKAAAVVFSINDIFNSQRFGTIYNTDRFYQDSYRRWNVRTFRLTFSYRFGNSKADLFNKRKKQTARNNDEENDGETDFR